MVRTIRKVPKDWDKYEPIGNVVQGTRLFAFKTPLCYGLLRRFKKDSRFNVPDLYRSLMFRGMNLGLVINASNTSRYYDSREIQNMGINYVKLPLHGRGFTDCDAVVKSFMRAVDEFLANNKDNNLLIGIHCTDGVNRAGYLICRYLVDRLGQTSHEALNAVETARGYTIERGALIQAVHRADRERRLRKKRPNYESEEEQETDARDRKRKKRRQAKEAALLLPSALDDAHDQLDPAMMQQIMQLEQSLNSQTTNAALSTQHDLTQEYQQQFFEQQQQHRRTAAFQLHQQYHSAVHTHSETSSPYVDSPNVEEDELEEDEERTIDMSILGRVDVVEKSTAQRRRERRKKLETKFDVMKKGRIWEIQAMHEQK